MNYTTIDDLEARMGTTVYVQLTDDAGTGSGDTAKAAAALAAAEAEVDSYLAVRFAVPVEVAGEAERAEILKAVTLDLAEYRLHARRPPVTEAVVRKRAEAVRWLERVASGAVQLPGGSVPAARTSGGTVARVRGAQRVFTRDSMEHL